MRLAEVNGERWLLVGALFATAVLAGASTVAVGVDDRQMPPLWDAALRFGCATPLFFGIVGISRIRMPHGRALIGACFLGVLNFTVANAFSYLALRSVQPGLAQIIATLNPLFTVVFAWLHRLEPLRFVTIFGVVLGAGGVSIAVGAEGSKAAAISLTLLILAVMCSAEGYVLGRVFPGLHPITTAAVAVPIGAVLLFCWAVVAGESLALPSSTTGIVAFAYNVTFGTIGLFGLYLWLVRRWGAVRTSYMYLVAPIVAVTLGGVFFQERLTLALLAGSALVLAGVYIGVLRNPVPVELNAVSAKRAEERT